MTFRPIAEVWHKAFDKPVEENVTIYTVKLIISCDVHLPVSQRWQLPG